MTLSSTEYTALLRMMTAGTPIAPVGEVRLHPDDDPASREARRVIKAADGPWWIALGIRPEHHTPHDVDVADWPRQALTDVAYALELDEAQGYADRLSYVESEREYLRDQVDELTSALQGERISARCAQENITELEDRVALLTRQRDMSDRVSESARRLWNQAETEAHEAETRAASWWEAVKDYARSLNEAIRVIGEIEKEADRSCARARSAENELTELKSALSILSS